MALEPGDRQLAAYLMETELVSVQDLLEALTDADRTGRPLRESLVRLGKLSRAEVLSLGDGRRESVTPMGGVLRSKPERAKTRSGRPDETQETWAFSETEEEFAARTQPGVPAELDDPYGRTLRRQTDPPEVVVMDPEATLIPFAERAPDEPFVTGRVSARDPFEESSGSFPSEGRGVEVEFSSAEEPVGVSGRARSERYQLFGEIGRGGMGRILKARDREIGREVAIKILFPGRESIENEVRRFWMEVQATGQLEHPSIIPVHDVGRMATGELFYVMKLLSGQTLAEVLEEQRRERRGASSEYSRARLLTAFQQISYAVAFAHKRGVLHRDVKPANIMIGRYGEAMLLDWGLAKLAGSDSNPRQEEEPRVEIRAFDSIADTADGTVTGTPQYMSPEATEGRSSSIGAPSDVYSLGTVLYEILTLEPAFEDEGFMKTLITVREGRFRSPKRRAPGRDISPELDELCLAAMHKDPRQRPTAKELADDIGRILEGTREQERRTNEARLFVSEGQSAVDRWKILRTDLRIAGAETRRLAKTVPAWAPPSEKEILWSQEDRVAALEVDSVSAFAEAEAAFLRALGERPDWKEARGAIAALYFEQFSEAERERDEARKRYYGGLVQRYGDESWTKLLQGDGSLSIETSEGGVEVYLSRFELDHRVLRPGPAKLLGTAPLGPVDLPIGSYLLLLRHARNQSLLCPVRVGRAERVELAVDIVSEAEVGRDYVYVPAGPCILGGDSIAHGALERKVKSLPGFFIGRYPVTCGEYLEFLNAVAAEDPNRARAHAPRVSATEGHYWSFDAEKRTFSLPRDSERFRWRLSHPVIGVSHRDAASFAAWKSEKTGQPLRLPHEDEWEKAARGVDGRIFPWGDYFDATFCKMKDSRENMLPFMEPVGSFSVDCSPYGMYDAAGGVREICETQENDEILPVMRGGCWHDTGLFCRLAFRHVTHAAFVNTGLGFRLVKDLHPSS